MLSRGVAEKIKHYIPNGNTFKIDKMRGVGFLKRLTPRDKIVASGARNRLE